MGHLTLSIMLSTLSSGRFIPDSASVATTICLTCNNRMKSKLLKEVLYQEILNLGFCKNMVSPHPALLDTIIEKMSMYAEYIAKYKKQEKVCLESIEYLIGRLHREWYGRLSKDNSITTILCNEIFFLNKPQFYISNPFALPVKKKKLYLLFFNESLLLQII